MPNSENIFSYCKALFSTFIGYARELLGIL